MDNGLALTPPMGWNSWNQVRCHDLTEGVVKAAADTIASNGMRESGYEYVVVDDCYQGGRDPHTGRLIAHPERFPGGMRELGDYIHSKGLKFGIYGVPGSQTCANFWDNYPIQDLGSLGREELDAQTWADWGVDYLKYDWCRADVTDRLEKVPAFTRMRDALAATGRGIAYAVSEYGDDEPWTWGARTANLWRTTQDILPTWNSVAGIINAQADLWPYSCPGAWNDPDMLQVGNGEFTDDVEANQAHIGMWAMLAAPLFLGTSVAELDPRIRALLTNPDVVAIDQDPLGQQARRHATNRDGTQVWARPLEGNGFAVALYNPGTERRHIRAALELVIGAGDWRARSVWEQQEVDVADGNVWADVAPRGLAMHVLRPA